MVFIANLYCFLDIIVQMMLLNQYLAQTNIHGNISVIVNSFKMEPQAYFFYFAYFNVRLWMCLLNKKNYKLQILVVKMCSFTTVW